MPKPRKTPRDPNQLAAHIVALTTGTEPPGDLAAMTGAQVGNPPILSEEKPKNAAAVALGRLGGLKGGDARARTLTPEQRSEIARKAASKRWTSKGK